eukprot:1330548-Alexandrium_andersonii.AAC.1
MSNMVFQGTVFGPPLWNIFFADAHLAIESAFVREIVYADDLNAYRVLDAEIDDTGNFEMIAECQRKLHRWGACLLYTSDAADDM